jgi:hypothetical protein
MTLEFTFNPAGIGSKDFIDQYLDILFANHGIIATNIVQKEQDYGKIVPIDEYERQKFILWATDNWNIYSLGRYATWRQILLDDVMKDIGVITKFIEQRNNYARLIKIGDKNA